MFSVKASPSFMISNPGDGSGASGHMMMPSPNIDGPGSATNGPTSDKKHSASLSETIPHQTPSAEPPADLQYDPVAAAKGWQAARDAFALQDEKMIKAYQEEIDSILIFAGLFSAILTAFVAQTYQNLQPASVDTTNSLLIQISEQLADPTRSPVASMNTNFEVQQSDLRVNILWFVSLILSLGSSIFAIFIKQWLRSYMTWVDVSPAQTAVTIRQYRYNAMLKWGLHGMVVIVPIQLQTALVLFGIGLVDFALRINHTMGIVICVFASAYLLGVLCVSFLPFFYSSTPYRSPWSVILNSMRCIVAFFHAVGRMMYVGLLQLSIYLISRIATSMDWNSLATRLSRIDDELEQHVEKVMLAMEERCFDPDTGLHPELMSRTWNEVDELRLRKPIRQLHRDNTGPSWEATSINSLMSSAHDESDLFNSALACVYRREAPKDSGASGARLHIADCCVVAGWFFGMRSKLIENSDEDTILRFSDELITSLNHRTKENIYLLLRLALKEYITTPTNNKELDDYAGRALRMLGCVLPFSNIRDGLDRVFPYMEIMVGLLGDDNNEGYPRAGLLPYIMDGLFLGYCSLPKAVPPLGSVFRMWADRRDLAAYRAQILTMSIQFNKHEWSYLERRHETQLRHRLLQTIEGQLTLSLTLALIATAHQHMSADLPDPFKKELQRFFEFFAKSLSLTSYASEHKESRVDLTHFTPEFWQSIHILARSQIRSDLFSTFNTLPRHLCVIAQRLTYPSRDIDDRFILQEDLDGMVNPHLMGIEDVWNTLSEHAQWLGSQWTEADPWLCPGFVSWTEEHPPASNTGIPSTLTPGEVQLYLGGHEAVENLGDKSPDLESHGFELDRLPSTSMTQLL